MTLRASMAVGIVGSVVLMSSAFAGELDCVDTARTNPEVDACAMDAISRAETRVENLFAMVGDRLKGQNGANEMLAAAQQNWSAYRNVECLVEAAAVNGSTAKPVSVDANRAFVSCVYRTAIELEAALQKALK